MILFRTARNTRLWICLIAITMMVAACSPSENGVSGSTRRILWFSDIHFNPFYDPDIIDQLVACDASGWDDIMAGSSAHASFPKMGQESNRFLLESVLADLRSRDPSPDIILFTGDFLAHKFNQTYQSLTGDHSVEGIEKFIDKTLAYIVSRYELVFPDTPVHFCLGNNDSYDGDYLISSGDRFLSSTAGLFGMSFIKDDVNRQRFMATYPTFGNYSAIIPGSPSNRLIMLNAIFLSARYGETSADAGMMQLDWLEETLRENPDISTWIVLHIPPGVDVFATMEANPGPIVSDVTPLIKECYLDRLLAVLDQYGQNVRAILAGHIHRDDFRLVFTKPDDLLPITFIRTVPSVSPVYYNNPGYKILSVDSTSFTILQEETVYLDLVAQKREWQTEYRFELAYGAPELTPAWLYSIWADMGKNGTLREAHMQYYPVSNTGEITNESFSFYWQAMRHLKSADYLEAVNNSSMQTRNDFPIWFVLAGSSFDSMVSSKSGWQTGNKSSHSFEFLSQADL